MLFAISPYLPSSWTIDVPIEQFRISEWKRPVFLEKMKRALAEINQNPKVYTHLETETQKLVIRMEIGLYLYSFPENRWKNLRYIVPMQVLIDSQEAILEKDLKYVEKTVGKLEMQFGALYQLSKTDMPEKAIYLFLEQEGYSNIVLIHNQFYGKHAELFGDNERHLIQREELEYLNQLLSSSQVPLA
jgi:hypothetical protein